MCNTRCPICVIHVYYLLRVIHVILREIHEILRVFLEKKKKEAAGFEPTTSGTRVGHPTTELHCQTPKFQKNYNDKRCF